MRIIITAYILLNCCLGFAQEAEATKGSFDNKELKEIYKSDQSDRAGNIDWSKVGPRDSLRQVRIKQLLDSNKVLTPNDYYHAAMIFQHGEDSTAYDMAVNMMRRAVELDPSRSKYLLAAAIDRSLMSRGLPQIYGTQYTKSSEGGPWELYKIDTTKITAESERIMV